MVWAILFGGLMLLGIAALFFLIHSAQKFRFVAALSHNKKGLRLLIGAALILLPAAGTWLLWGYMNTIAILLHLAVFWAAAALVQFVLQKRRKQPLKRYYAGAVAVAVTVLYLGAGYFAANHVWQTNYTLTTAKKVGTLRVALLSDSHVGTTFSGKGLAAHIRRINAQKPDVVVVTGDFVDESTSKEDMLDACSALGQLNPAYGVYFVFGNHDKGKYANGKRSYTGDDLIAQLQKNNVTVLQDEAVLIDNRFYLVGRQDASEELDFGGSRATAAELTSNLNQEKYTIVLDHQPRDYAAEANTNADLVLSGHTHGGQMIPLMQFMRWFHLWEDNIYGLERHNNTDFIVTSGISDWAMQFKTGCISEYVMITVMQK